MRLSGPRALELAPQLVELNMPLEHARARMAYVLDNCADAEIVAHAQTDSSAHPLAGPVRIDEAIVTFFAAPNSYTAEDLVEIAAHGSPVVLELLLRRALSLGARLAEPGEFTQRAFLAGRIDLTQAEAVQDLIAAQTLTQARQAASQLGGALSRRVAPIKQSLIELIALLEAGIDFAEDDVDVTSRAEITRRIHALTFPLDALESTFARGHIIHDGLSLAIVGRPNVGKSSLFNRLVERDRAIVTASPGTTRDLVSERIALGGIPIEMVDTAGLREALEEVEQLGIARSREALADAALVLVVLDATQQLNDEEHRLLAAIEGRSAVVVRNKCDLAGDGIHPLDLPASLPVIQTSALTGSGLAELRDAILTLATGGAASEPGLLTTIRHQQAIHECLAALTRAANGNQIGLPHEMLLLDLYAALTSLDDLTGQTTTQDILNLIFSTFCIGK